MTATQPHLYLHEEIMLLALRDEKGSLERGTMWYAQAMGGAILTDLILANRISIEDEKKKMVELVDSTPMGNEEIDDCLEKVATAKRRATAQTWVSRFSSIKKLHHRVAEGLCQKRILREDQDKVLLFFTRKIFPEINPQPEKEIIERLRKAIFTETRDIDARTAALVAITKGAGLLNIHFDSKELKERKDRLEAICSGNLVGKATTDAIQAIQVAIMAGSICCTTTVTCSS